MDLLYKKLKKQLLTKKNIYITSVNNRTAQNHDIWSNYIAERSVVEGGGGKKSSVQETVSLYTDFSTTPN